MPISNRKQLEKEIKITAIVEAAEQVFFEKGYKDCKMSEIAKAADYTKRSLYKYFESKEMIYWMVMTKAFKTLNAIIIKLLAQEQPVNGLEKVLLLGKAWLVLNDLHPNYFAIIHDFENFDRKLAQENEQIALCYQESDQTMQVLFDSLLMGKEDGSLSHDIDITKTALILWGQMIGLVNLLSKKSNYINQAHGVEKEQLIQATFQFLYQALAKKGE